MTRGPYSVFFHSLLICLTITVSLCTIPYTAKARSDNAERFLDIKTLQTPKGISVWYVADQSLPIISISFAFRGAGAKNETDDTQGLAQMLGITIDEGAGPYDADAFQKELQDHSISLSFSANRDHFYGEMRTLSRTKDKAFELLRYAITDPHFDTDAVDRMCKSQMAAIRQNLSSPEWKASRITFDALFKNHAYARNAGGTLSTLPTITPTLLRKHHQTYLTRDRLFVGVTGDIDPASLAELIDTVFGDLPLNEKMALSPSSMTDALSTLTQNKMIFYQSDIPQTYVIQARRWIGRSDPDYYASVVLDYILGGGGFGSRLFENIRENAGLSYGIYTSPFEWAEAAFVLTETSVANDTLSPALEAITDEYRKIVETPFTADEIAAAKDYLTGSMGLALTSSMSIADLMLSLQLRGQPADYLDHYADNIRNVTEDDLIHLARRLIKNSPVLTVMVGNPKDRPEGSILLKELPNAQ